MSDNPIIKESLDIASNHKMWNEIYLTSSSSGRKSEKIQTETQTSQKQLSNNHIISIFSFDKMILNFPKLESNPFCATLSKRKRLQYFNNNIHQNTPATAYSSTLELQKFDLNNNQLNKKNLIINKENTGNVPKSFMLNHRDYTKEEKKMISQINLEELEMRSPGKGMFIKIGQYRNIVKPLPFQLNEEDLLPSNYTKTKKTSNIIKQIHNKIKYDKKKVFEKDNEQMMRFRAKQRKIREFDSTNINNNEGTSKIKGNTIKGTIKERMRDKKMLHLMMKFGEKQLMYKLFNLQGSKI